MEKFDRITINPEVMGGQPCIRGLRIHASLVVKLVSMGKTADDIIKSYPELEKEDIQQALKFAAWMVSERTLPTIK